MAESEIPHIDRLKGAKVVIFGGTSGIGFAVAQASLAQGANIVIASSQQAKVDKAISRLHEWKPDGSSSISSHVCDLSKTSELEDNVLRLLEAAASRGKIDHIVLTAGDALKIKPLFETSVPEMLAAGNVRFLAALVIGKLTPKFINPGPKSSITFTGGTNSHRPMPGWTLPAAWGSGVEGAMRGLAVDLAPIRVNVVSPGAIHTELFGSMTPEALEGVLQKYRDWSVTGTVGSPAEAAESYIYLMRSSFTTGTVVVCDGGRCVK